MDIERIARAGVIFLMLVSLGCFWVVCSILLYLFEPIKYLFIVILLAITFYCSYLLAER